MEETTHARTVALLPWHLNGTLDPGERREVEEHLETCADCRAELTETRGAFALYGAHLPPSLLVQHAEVPDARLYGTGGLPVERRLVDAHLDHCDACRDELELTLASYRGLHDENADGGEGLATVTPFARPGLGSAGGGLVAERGFDTPRWVPMALAASLLVAVISAGGWGFTAQRADTRAEAQRQEIAELEGRLLELEKRQRAPRADGESSVVESGEDGLASDTGASNDLQGELRDLRERYARAESRAQDLDRQVADLRRGVPIAGAIYVPLEGGDVVRSTAAADVAPVPRIELDGTGGVFLQPAVPADLLAAGGLTYRLRGPDGATVVEGPLPVVDMTAQGLGRYVSLTLPADLLPAGSLTLEILAEGETVGEHAFQVQR